MRLIDADKIMEVLHKFKSILESDGYTVAAVFLYGSQNYDLDIYTNEYTSDIDAKAIIIPNLDDLVYNSKPISFVKQTEFGQVDVKDIRTYIDTLVKANPAYVETLYTDYFVVDDKFTGEISKIMALRDDLVYALRGQFMRAIYGMMCEKDAALCHPYPATMAKIEKWGYDGKQLSHNFRLLCLMHQYFIEKINLKLCFKPTGDVKSLIIKYKLNIPSLDDAKFLSSEFIANGKILREKILLEINESTIDYSVKDKIIVLSRDIIKKHIEKNIIDKGL